MFEFEENMNPIFLKILVCNEITPNTFFLEKKMPRNKKVYLEI